MAAVVYVYIYRAVDLCIGVSSGRTGGFDCFGVHSINTIGKRSKLCTAHKVCYGFGKENFSYFINVFAPGFIIDIFY